MIDEFLSIEQGQLIDHLSHGIRRSIDLVQKTHQYIQEKIYTSQTALLTIIEQVGTDFIILSSSK